MLYAAGRSSRSVRVRACALCASEIVKSIVRRGQEEEYFLLPPSTSHFHSNLQGTTSKL